MSFRARYRIKGTSLYVKPTASAYPGASQAPRMSRWRPAFGGPNSLLADAAPMLRARSRDLVRRDGKADNGIQVMVANAIGTGIVPQFNTPSVEFNRELSTAFLEWTDEADADGRLDFYGLQALAFAAMAEGGEVFTRLRIRRLNDGLSVPLQIQLLEAEYCPDDKNEQLPNGNWVRCGVEFNAIGRRVAYHLYRNHPLDWAVNPLGDLNTVPVPASEVAHMAALRRPGMIRGEPWLTRSIVKLHELDQYDDAQLIRQKIAALFAGFVTEDAPELEGDEESLFGGEPDDDGTALASLEPGTVQYLRRGQDMKWSSPPDPGNSYAEFMRQQDREAAVSMGILYEQLTGDYSQGNDRTWRAAVNEFRRRCALWQHNIVVFQFARPILRRWAEAAVLSGRVRPPAGVTAATIARATWVPQGWAYINPVQDVQAQRLEVRSGFKSREQVVSERGDDIHEVDAKIAADNARADTLGIVLDTDPRRTSAGGASQAKPAGSEYVEPGETRSGDAGASED